MTRPEGSQSIGRAVQLLGAVAERGEEGARLMEIAQATGFHFATARRILQALVAEGLLAFDPGTKLYVTGPAVFSLAVRASSWLSRRELFVPALEAIARRTGDTALLSMRSGDEAVCLERREGNFPIRVMSLDRGSRRPLGAGSGSLAILAFLGEEERVAIARRSAVAYGTWKLTPAVVLQDVATARRAGYSLNPSRLIEGIWGVGVPVLSGGIAIGAMSVAAIESRLGPARQEEVVAIMHEELGKIPGIELPPRPARKTRKKVA